MCYEKFVRASSFDRTDSECLPVPIEHIGVMRGAGLEGIEQGSAIVASANVFTGPVHVGMAKYPIIDEFLVRCMEDTALTSHPVGMSYRFVFQTLRMAQYGSTVSPAVIIDSRSLMVFNGSIARTGRAAG